MLKNLLLISGFSTFVVIVIIGLNLYHGHLMPSLSSNTIHHTVAITPTFDKKTLDTLKKREQLNVNLDEKSSVISEDSKKTSVTTPTPTEVISNGTDNASTSANTTPATPATPLNQ